MAIADLAFLLSAAIGGGLLLLPILLRAASKDVSGKATCFPECKAMPVTILDQLTDMLARPPGGMFHPLNRYWWQISESNYKDSFIRARMEYVEDVVTNSPHGSRARDAMALVRTMEMTWTVVPANGGEFLVEIAWSGQESVPLVVSCDRVARTMQLMTEEVIQRLNSVLSLNQAKRYAALSGGSSAPTSLSSRFPSQQAKMLFGRHKTEDSPARFESKETSSWPSPQDFNEAIQTPLIAFDRAELQQGIPELNMMGMPKVASGSFASVYKLQCPDMNRAIRCFLHPVRDQQYRYEQLSKSISGNALECTVDFEYVARGIRVSNRFYPVLQMEWVDGISFNDYIDSLIERGESITPLLEKFRAMMESLHRAGIAHGDLQHGNIIVRNDKLVLVDYDGMFVPSLRMEHSNELGHPNYQHPSRSKEHFGAYLDNFSAHLIDTSLLALSVNPSLWGKHDGGDECLLFRRRDLHSPDRSTVFADLLTESDPRVNEKAEVLRSFLAMNVQDVPALAGDGRLLSPVCSVQGTICEGTLPDWLTEVD